MPMVNIVEFYETLDSTNQMAADTIACSRDNTCSDSAGYLVFCDEQTKGRGRGSNRWFSPPGGLYFSLAIAEIYPPAMSLIAAYSVVRALESQAGVDTLIKWPNDILLNDRKLAGILIQTIDGHTIIGTGINTFSDEKKGNNPDIANIHLPSLDRRIDLMIETVNNLKKNIDLLKSSGFNRMKEDVSSKLAWHGEKVRLENGNLNIEGIFNGIDDEGRVIIGEGQPGAISGTLRRI